MTFLGDHDTPNHEKPSSIPPQKDKSRTLCFQKHWYNKFPWLHFSPQLQGVICFQCSSAIKRGLMKTERCEPTFTTIGFRNWKKALEKFSVHQASVLHRQAVFKISQQDKGVNVALQLSKQNCKQQELNRKSFLAVVQAVRYLLRQGMPFRGHAETEGNLQQLLLMQAELDPELRQWLRRSTTFTSHECIEEIQNIFSHTILRAIIADIKDSQQYAVILDGTQDIKMKEQESVCIRHVDQNLEVHEDFVGFYEQQETTGAALASTVKDALLRLGLDLTCLRGQTYDGAANMAGKFNGCQAILRAEYPLCLHFHCAAHCVNLVSQHACQADAFLTDALQLVQDLGTFYKRSGKFNKLFSSICGDSVPAASTTIKPLCPTRWLYRYAAVSSVLSNYEAILKSLYEFGQKTGDGKARNLYDGLKSGVTYLALSVAMKVTGPLHELNRVLQAVKQTVSGMLENAKTVEKSLQQFRSEKEFSEIFQQAQAKVDELDLDPIKIPRMRRPPKRYSGPALCHHASTPEDHYRKSYFAVIDAATQQLGDRLDTSSTSGLVVYQELENFLLSGGLENEQVISRYPELDVEHLKVQVKMFHMNYKPTTLFEVKESLRSMSVEMRALFREVETLLRLLLVCPVTSCQAERSFSALRRLKNWLRNTMGQVRLNSATICHVHKHRLDEIDLRLICKEFIGRTETRRNAFGH